MNRDDLIIVLKSMQWEKCKGELRSLANIHGACASNSAFADSYGKLCNKIESFIDEMETEFCD
jgi:hypothetical protein